MRAEASCDVVVVGGGVAGLWTRCVLAAAGLSVVLVEASELGAGQTVASQGILHAGLKYAVTGEVREGSRLLAACGPRWREAMDGRGEVDLRGVGVLADGLVMWTMPDAASRVVGAFGSAFLRSSTRRLEGAERAVASHGVFAGAPRGVSVWRVEEPAVDARSLVWALAGGAEGPMVRASVAGLERLNARVVVTLEGAAHTGAGEPGERVRLRAGAVVLAAGVGNEALLSLAGVDAGAWCQRRPLRMGLVRAAGGSGPPLPWLLGHCVRASDKPRLTVTSGEDAGGRVVWYVGGEVAERGVERDEESQRAAVKDEVRACLPWLEVGDLDAATLPVDRAEGRTPGGVRPEGPVVRAVDGWGGRVVVVWPTKLALAPVVGDLVKRAVVEGAGVRGGAGWDAGKGGWTGGFGTPAVAGPVWARDGVVWR